MATTLLHEALAPYLIVAQPRTWFSYAWFCKQHDCLVHQADALLVRSLIDALLPTDGVQSGWAPCPKNPGACELQVHAPWFPAS